MNWNVRQIEYEKSILLMEKKNKNPHSWNKDSTVNNVNKL